MSTLEWLQRNVELNVSSKRARARRLVWGSVDDARALLRDGGFDLLVGSDLLYDTANYGPLVDSIVSLAPARGANFGVRDAPRRRGDLAELAAARGPPRNRRRSSARAAKRRDGDDADEAIRRCHHLSSPPSQIDWPCEVACPCGATHNCQPRTVILSSLASTPFSSTSKIHDARRAAVPARADALAALEFAASSHLGLAAERCWFRAGRVTTAHRSGVRHASAALGAARGAAADARRCAARAHS